MTDPISFSLKTVVFDENYRPADNTRITTNFANLARGKRRQENLRNVRRMIDDRVNDLAYWDNPEKDRYAVTLEIVSVEMSVGADAQVSGFPVIEILRPRILDRHSGRTVEGIAGNNFSSYVRDYDFSVVLPEYLRDRPQHEIPDDFGDLHGKIFRGFVASDFYRRNFGKPPVICLSVSSSRTYSRSVNSHPVLGVEYHQDADSLTDRYFAKMGLRVRYFMPPGAVAPLAFYHSGDLLNDYGHLELIATIGTMESFQRIYRPEIYNANAAAAAVFRPSLTNQDYSTTRIVYDREERSQLAVEQGRFAQTHFVTRCRDILERWTFA